ncbi:MAG TPA: tetratricopeptide repeat protein, partial [Anaerolineae bacterium]|nr:tetratricopeptide repeat protein [Anaerolineae bacterium]
MMAEIALHEYVRQMKQLIKEGRYDEVVAHGRHILKQYPKYLEVYRVLGEAMLEAGQEDQAENMFSRVLSGDPENFVAHAGMSVIYDRRGDLDKALWHMERAFEISPDNPAIRNELRRLYGRKTGVEPGRLDLTPATLARLYARGGRYRRAIEEFRSLLEENPDRVDLQVALAEALWKNEQRIQAEELCLGILEQLPFCLKANLILGEIYTRTGRKEGKECLAKAEALDPENRVAAALFGDESPLPLREVHIERLEYSPPEEERPSWMPEAPTTEIEVAPETQIEIPAWLEEISGGEEAPTPAEEEEEEVGLEVPSWLGEPGLEEIGEEPSPPLEEPAPPEPEAEAPAEAVPPPEPAEIPDWIREMAPPEVKREEERAEPPAPPPEPAEIPDWLKEMAPPEVKEEAAPTTPPAEAAEAVPEWLAEAISLTEEKPPVPEMPAEEGIPEWPAEPTPEEAPPLEEPTPPLKEEPSAPEAPEWLEGEGLPSGDEALAWLGSLA